MTSLSPFKMIHRREPIHLSTSSATTHTQTKQTAERNEVSDGTGQTQRRVGVGRCCDAVHLSLRLLHCDALLQLLPLPRSPGSPRSPRLLCSACVCAPDLAAGTATGWPWLVPPVRRRRTALQRQERRTSGAAVQAGGVWGRTVARKDVSAIGLAGTGCCGPAFCAASAARACSSFASFRSTYPVVTSTMQDSVYAAHCGCCSVTLLNSLTFNERKAQAPVMEGTHPHRLASRARRGINDGCDHGHLPLVVSLCLTVPSFALCSRHRPPLPTESAVALCLASCVRLVHDRPLR